MNSTQLQVTISLPRWLAALILTGVLAAGLLLALGADPGSKEDPLVTISYIQRYSQFSRQEFPAGRSLKLGIGAEFIPADMLQTSVSCRGLDAMRDNLIDLTAGQSCTNAQLQPGHHYINAGTHDIFLAFDTETAVLVRGEWK
jgi:hypothetical protein